MTKEELIADLKERMFENLPISHLNKEDIGADTLLFDKDGAGLDSLDAVEFVTLLETGYGVKISDYEAAKKICASLSTVADHILEPGSKP